MEALRSIAKAVDNFSDKTGKIVAWTALALVIIQFVVVVMRYVFGVGSVFAQESLLYLFGSRYMLGAGYTRRHDAHVRVDVFYRSATARFKAWVDLAGVVLMLLPMCAVIWIHSVPYVMASWAVREGSRETSGIQAVYLLKTEILIFCVLVAIQGIAMALHALMVLKGRETRTREEAPHL
jgi:TRAP-type mannitol/chloroaromatic compound transport system permease small subunit